MGSYRGEDMIGNDDDEDTSDIERAAGIDRKAAADIRWAKTIQEARKTAGDLSGRDWVSATFKAAAMLRDLAGELERLRGVVAIREGELERFSDEIEMLKAERDHLARDVRHALLSASGYIAGQSLSNAASIQKNIREALKHPAMRFDDSIDLSKPPPGPPPVPLPKCGKCGHGVGDHGPRCGPCNIAGCQCRGYLFPGVA